MVWLVVALVIIVFAYFEWRSRNKPLSHGLDGQVHAPGEGGENHYSGWE